MRQAGRGAIVNISSTAGRLGFPLRLPYATSKFAITGLTKTLAIELGPANISVNAILPGYILNERGARVIRAKAEAAGRTVEEMQAAILGNIAMRTGIEEQEIADLALYLCSDSGRPHLGPAARRRRRLRHLHGHGQPRRPAAGCRRRVIVLFTDFGPGGPYTGQMKAVLAREAPGTPVVDLADDLPACDPEPAAYLLAAFASAFPPGAVFVCVVRSGRRQRPGAGRAQRR